jgi:hypothetical protein
VTVMVEVEDRKWMTFAGPEPSKLCRWGSRQNGWCRQPSVAALQRGSIWFNYCADHLYGRRIEGRKMMTTVPAGSPAAERGYVE